MKAADMLSEGRGFGSHLSHVHILIWITPTLAACAFYVVNSPSPSPSVGSERVFLYTLPYDFNDFSYYDVTQSKFTYSNAIEYPVYDRVHALRHSFSDTLLMNETVYLTPRFSSITDLQLNPPLSEHFCSCLTSLDHLKSLHVTLG